MWWKNGMWWNGWSSLVIGPLRAPAVLITRLWSGKEYLFIKDSRWGAEQQKAAQSKGTRPKLLSRFFTLMGLPPISAKGFWAGWFSVKGGGGYPPIPLKSRFFRSENAIFCLFSFIFSPFWLLYGLFGPFLTLFNTKTSFLDLLGKQISGKV